MKSVFSPLLSLHVLSFFIPFLSLSGQDLLFCGFEVSCQDFFLSVLFLHCVENCESFQSTTIYPLTFEKFLILLLCQHLAFIFSTFYLEITSGKLWINFLIFLLTSLQCSITLTDSTFQERSYIFLSNCNMEIYISIAFSKTFSLNILIVFLSLFLGSSIFLLFLWRL